MTRLGARLAVVAATMVAGALVPGAARAEPDKAAMLLPGSINDQSWNAAGYGGLTRMKELGFQIAHSENVQAADHIEAMRDFAGRGFKVVIGHSGRFLAAAERVGPDFPKVQFIVGSGAKGNGANVRSIDANAAQFGFVTGVLAARMSKTGVIGAVSGLEGLPTIVAHVGGFRLGVLSVKPNAKVRVIYLKSMEDAALAKEAALSLIAEGADVVSGKLNAGHAGLVQAAKDKGVLVTGRSLEHSAMAPQLVMTNVVDDWPAMYAAAAQELKSRGLKGDFTVFGFDTAPVTGSKLVYAKDLALNPTLPKAVVDEIDAVIARLARKELVLSPTREDARGGF